MTAPVAALSDYAIIGDCRSAALVSKNGSVDWLCWPRFDSPSLFGALLDPEVGGRFAITPAGPHRVTRRYVDGTNVLETTFDTAEGSATLTDLMPVVNDDDRGRTLLADHELLRVVECRRGHIALAVDFSPRPGFAMSRFRMKDHGPVGVRLEAGSTVVLLRSETPLAVAGGSARGHLHLSAGQRVRFSLSYTEEAPAVMPLLGARVDEDIVRAVERWRQWSAQLRYQGRYADAVLRSALTLKLLCYAPSGAIVAAPTTSLPERVGGDMNWDYRYCWLRDASLTVRSLVGLGFNDEAEGFASWLLHATRLTRPKLSVLYDVYGVVPGRERTLNHLSGYRGSRPVRVGNAAAEQHQLDVYGEVIEATMRLQDVGYVLDRESLRMLRSFGDFIAQHWARPDAGMWEIRGDRRRHTTSLVLSFLALQKLSVLTEGDSQSTRLREVSEVIRAEIETRGWNPTLGSYVEELGGDSVDASLLLLPIYGYAEPDSPRVVATVRRVLHDLAAGPGLVYRNLRRLPPEGAFGICSFWAAEALARGAGTLAEAEAAFEQTMRHANDLGLFAEEIDPATGEALGNFPQGFTHVGLINTALALERRARQVPQPRRTARRGVEAPGPVLGELRL